MVINTGFGPLIASSTCEYETIVEHDNNVTKQIQRTSLIGQLSLPAGTSLSDMHEELLKSIDEVCVALSLCYRQKVDFYEIEYMEHTREGHFRQAGVRRRRTSSRLKTERDQLIDVGALVDGGLETLIARIRGLRDVDTVRRSISFLAASSDATVETAYFMAFSAMEAIVNSCLEADKTFAVKAGKWGKVEKELKGAIDEIAIKLGLPLEALKAKLPELRRISLDARVLAVCELLGPKIHDLWCDIGFPNGLERATKVRNGLFHTAGAKEPYSMYGDLVRIRTLAERIILKLLDWPDDKIWTWYDQELRRVN